VAEIQQTNPEVVEPTTTRDRTARASLKPLTVAAVFLLVLSTGFIGGWLGSKSRDHESQVSSVRNGQQVIVKESEVINQIAKDVGPSVVSVNVTGQSVQSNFFGFSQPVESSSAGTGIIISKDGYILTNRHVVPEGTSTVSVTMADGTSFDNVDVIGRTSQNDSLDVAFLKIKDLKGKQLKPAKIGDSAQVKVGDKVVAIGNALGQFQNTVTSGIISGYGRSLVAGDESGGSSETLQNLFQTDAAINQGNSGGPLVNLNGEVIGINTAIAGGSAENLGFAIPIDDTQGLIKSVLGTGKFQRPYLGVRYVALTDDYAVQYNVKTKRGAFVLPNNANGQPSILPNSPAEKAGLKERDIITKVDGTNIDETHSLTSLVGRKSVGDKVTLTVIRDDKEITKTVTLEASP
jgi:serine protease Do